MLHGEEWWSGNKAGQEQKEKEMLKLKNCTRCKGDMHTNRDLYGSYAECLQCGHMEYLKDTDTLQTRMKGRSKKTAAA
jgi:hypothetical protein